LLEVLDLKSEGVSSLLYILDLISEGALQVQRDREPLARFFARVATWKPDNQDSVRTFLEERAQLSLVS
jgi:hypothetical protein